MTGIAVTLDQVTFRYPETVFRFDARFEPGAITAVMGASGSGKSTLLNLVAGFEHPESGQVRLGEQEVTGLRPSERPISMIFQENNLFAHLDVAANVGLGRSPSLKLSAADRADVAEALAATGLAGKDRRLPRELSGGERQRVALARVLVRDRPVLLLDEPFASLGPALRSEMIAEVARLHRARGMTVLFVTHHPDDARRLASRIAFLDGGTIAAEGPVETFFGDTAPKAFTDYVGDYVGAATASARIES